MYCNVILVLGDERHVLFDNVVLDYFNIRDWRVLVHHLTKYYDSHPRIIIDVINNDVF